MEVEQQHPLDERKEQILREIVEGYVRSGEPMASKSVADGAHLGISSATIRNEMGVLEREGYISHPHTSAGRVPTDKGYRYYVDVLAPKVAADPHQRREIQRFMAGAVSALDELLERASQLLVDLTDYTSLASPPPVGESRLARVELVKLSGTRVLLVCVGMDGWHEDRLFELQTELSDDDVRRATALATPIVAGRTLVEASNGLRAAGAPSGLETLLAAVAESLLGIARQSGRVVTGGTSRLVVWEPAETAKLVLEMLETGVQPLLPTTQPNHVTVRIGREFAVEDLRDLSLIATGYRFGRNAGTLGVLGPTRMDYPAVISTVAEVASTLSRVLRQLEG
jgi:heat-inducible transcriptional repressor